MSKRITCSYGCCWYELGWASHWVWRNRVTRQFAVSYCQITGQKLNTDGTVGPTYAALEAALADATRGIGVKVEEGSVQDDN